MIVRTNFNRSGVKLKQLRMKLTPGVSMGQALFNATHSIMLPGMRERLRQHEAIDTGYLFRNVGVNLGKDSRGVYADTGSIGVKYGLDVEKGRDPFNPDYSKLRGWVKRKLKPDNVFFATRNVGKKIREQGIEPQPYIMNTFRANRIAMRNAVSLNLKRSISRI